MRLPTIQSSLTSNIISCPKLRRACGGSSMGVTASGSAGMAGVSEWPRGGSLTTNFSSKATSTPGRPTMRKASRQDRYCAMTPPNIAPSIPPSGMPKA